MPGWDDGFEVRDGFVQAALRPMFQLWDNEALTDEVRHHASAGQIQMFAVYVTHADVENGGVRQWHYNTYSCLQPQVRAGFRVLGFDAVADLLGGVVDLVFPDGFVFDVKQRRALLVDDPRDDGSSELSRSLDEADHAYYRLTGGERLEHGLLQWLVEHPDDFFASTEVWDR